MLDIDLLNPKAASLDRIFQTATPKTARRFPGGLPVIIIAVLVVVAVIYYIFKPSEEPVPGPPASTPSQNQQATPSPQQRPEAISTEAIEKQQPELPAPPVATLQQETITPVATPEQSAQTGIGTEAVPSESDSLEALFAGFLFKPTSVPKRARYYIQMASFGDPNQARTKIDQLKQKGIEAQVEIRADPKPSYKVRYGYFANRVEANKAAAELRLKGEQTWVRLIRR